jgi:hypothetical protein
MRKNLQGYSHWREYFVTVSSSWKFSVQSMHVWFAWDLRFEIWDIWNSFSYLCNQLPAHHCLLYKMLFLKISSTHTVSPLYSGVKNCTYFSYAKYMYKAQVFTDRVFSENITLTQLVKKFPACYGTRRFVYRLHKSPSLVRILSQMHATSHPIVLRSLLILSSHLGLGLLSCLFHSSFRSKSVYAFLLSPMRAKCPVHLILLHLNHPNYICWPVKVMKLLIMQSSPTSRHFLPLRSKCSPYL